MASIQSLGVGSGLLTSDLVEQIIEAERAPVEARLDNKQAIAEAKISAYGEITSSLSSFDAVIQSLKLPSTFNASTVSSSNEATVTGTASSVAVAGNYTVSVSQLAQAHSIASGSFEELTSTVGTGVINFRFGTTTYGGGGSYDSFELNADAPTKTIAITSANNTLAGVRDAVNNADFGVQASIVDDGSGYRLVFSGTESGAENSLEVTATGTDGLKALNYNATSQNASLTARTATSTLDLSTGGGLDSASLAFALAYQGSTMNVVVPANGSIADTEDALAAVQAALDTELAAAGFSAGDVLAKADGDRLYFESAAAGFDQELEVLTDGASAVLTGGALSDGFDFSANNAAFDIAVDGNPAQTLTLNTATASRQETVDLINTELTNLGLNTDVVASLNDDDELVFTRVSAGAANSIQISSIDSSGTAASSELGLVVADVDGLDGFGLDDSEGLVEGSVRMTETIVAQDALFTVNGLSISRADNLVTGVVTGTTLNLKGVTAGPVTLSVSKDSSSISTKLEEFVDSYNQLKALADELTAFDTTAGDNGQGSLLTGDSTLRMAISEINSLLRKSVTGLTGSVRSLSEIGITTDQNNSYQLTFDSAKFATKFSENSGAILSMFATSGSATDSFISYARAGSNTQPGTYDVEITRLATTGNYTGSSVEALALGNIVIDDDNDQFSVLLNGASAEISLVQGTYTTADDLAAHIQTRINSNEDYTASNHRVAVTYNSAEKRFEMTSNAYGASSNIGLITVETDMANSLGLTSPFQGDALGNQLGGLSTPNGLSSENFDDAVVLNAETSFVFTVNGISSSVLTVPGSSGVPVTYNSPDELIAAVSAQINNDPEFAFTPAQTAAGSVLTAGQDFSTTNLSVTLSLDDGSSETALLIDGDASTTSFGGQAIGTIENTLAAVQDAIDNSALTGLVTARLDGSNQIYFETVATGASSQIRVTENGTPAVVTAGAAVDGAGFDFASSNATFEIDIDNAGPVLVTVDTATVSAADTLVKVQDALTAAGLGAQVTATLDGSDQLVFTYASGNGASTEIELLNVNGTAAAELGISNQVVTGLDGLGIAETNNEGEDGLAVTVSYEYSDDSEQGRLVFSTENNSDQISFSSVSTAAGSKLGIVTGTSPRTMSVDGVDVAGTINGVEATGLGQTLIAGSGNIAAQPGFYLNVAVGDLGTSSVSDTFTLNVDGVLSDSITLGTISNTDPIAVAAKMQTAINNSPSLLAAGVSVTVEFDTNTGGFGIISNSTGSSSRVLVNSLGGNAAGIFGFASGAGLVGRTGTNASGEADDAAGIRLTVTGGELGSRGSVSYIKGIAEDLSVLLDTYLETGGLFSTRTSTLTTELESIADSRAALEERIARSEERLRTSFLANDIIISQLNSTADFLTSQLAALEALASGTSSD